QRVAPLRLVAEGVVAEDLPALRDERGLLRSGVVVRAAAAGAEREGAGAQREQEGFRRERHVHLRRCAAARWPRRCDDDSQRAKSWSLPSMDVACVRGVPGWPSPLSG